MDVPLLETVMLVMMMVMMVMMMSPTTRPLVSSTIFIATNPCLAESWFIIIIIMLIKPWIQKSPLKL
jgi:hypothetical protein